MPWWQMYFYFLICSTEVKNAFSGFTKEVNGFPLMKPYNLLYATAFLGSFDIIDFVLFTYIVKRKFKQFDPFRFMNLLVKKYNVLLGLSVMSVVISVQCVLIIDCRFNFTAEGVKAIGISFS